MIVTRDRAIPLLANLTLAAVTGSIRGLPTEVPVGVEHGLLRDSVINCDNLITLPKSALAARRGEVGPEGIRHLHLALRIALDLD